MFGQDRGPRLTWSASRDPDDRGRKTETPAHQPATSPRDDN